MFTYSQSSGQLFHDGAYMAMGYSGFGPGKNNPAAGSIPNVGPIPRGHYTIGQAEDHPKLGPFALPLTPDASTEMFGRSEFFIHGDSLSHPGEASHGCIVLPHEVRTAIASSQENLLTVVE